MKIMFISDIHGISSDLDIIRKKYNEQKCNKLVVLGDIYYIGPKNKMLGEYNISKVKDFLDDFKDEIICIKGNCDSEIDEVVNNFPMINGLGLISTNNVEIYITHGHIYNEDNWNYENKILVYGHFHIPFIKEKNNNLFINPGSISLPKGDEKASYLIYDDNNKTFTIYDIEDKILNNYRL